MAAAAQNPQINAESNSDVFSMTDDGLARRFQFQKEHGVGNWGSVWLAADKRDTEKREEERNKVAIKVVHRSKTQTTAARVRALWNEMKSVRALRELGEGHPSVVKFDCFIITPSYALIVMEFLPTPLTVPVDEQTAKPWMASLASAVEFMHERGVVHNDIKPANILLSARNKPTLVDFGFSERYSMNVEADADAQPDSVHGPFLSSLAYGTPEYLSPERAAGLVHDTRKADVWSLGVTFFELVFGRTPFEEDREASPTKNDANDAIVTDKKAMDAYWARTMKGKWLGVGTNNSNLRGKMSVGMEGLLRRMISPNADVRYTAAQVMRDGYWDSSSVVDSGKATALEKRTGNKAKIRSPKVLKKAGPAVQVPLQPPTSPPEVHGVASVVRTVLGNKGNVAVSSASKALDPLHKGEGKENVAPTSPPVIREQGQVQVTKVTGSGAGATKAQQEERGDSSLAVEQEALRVREIAADTRVDRMAIWVKNVERVVEDAKKTIARSDSQVLPPLPRAPGVESPSSPTPKSSSISPKPSQPRRRANDIFAAPSGPVSSSQPHRQRQRRPIAIGNSADLSAPAPILRHTVSADYPFNAQAVDGALQAKGQASDGVKVVLSRPEIRKIKSDLASGRGLHARTASYNSMYLRQAGPSPVPVIPEVRVEDVDDAKKSELVSCPGGEKPTPPADPVSFYDQLIVSTNVVERIGKGYQSNLCAQNDRVSLSRRTSAKGPPPPSISATGERVTQSVKRKLSASNFFLSMRGERPCDAEEAFIRTHAAGTVPGVATGCEIAAARPRRKIRQAASCDGFRNFAPSGKEKGQVPARPVSEHIPSIATPDHGVAKVEKKRSTVTKTMRKAFLAFIGGGVEKGN